MSKDRSFAAKIAKGSHKKANQCPVCGETYNLLKVVASEPAAKGSIRFKENMVGVCKCNEKEIYA